MIETIAQILGIIAVAFSVLSFQFQKGKNFFLFQLLLMLSFSVHFLLLGSYSGAALNLIGVFNSLIYYFKSENKRFAQGPVWLFVFSVLYLGAGVVIALSTGKWLEFLPAVAQVFNLFTRYSGNLKAIRLAQLLVSSPFWFAYNWVGASIGGCLNEALAFGSSAVALLRYDLPKRKLVIKTPAKINLCLSVNGKREDGYHELSTVMQTVSVFDFVTVKKAKEISVHSDNAPENEENICYKAAKMFEKFGGAEIFIEKNIPMAAGLGGGSSDAAAVLSALNILYKEPFSFDELSDMALSLGADVPFFLTGGTAFAEGVGEKLKKVEPFKCFLVLIMDGKKSSTGAMYSELDKMGLTDGKGKAEDFVSALSLGNVKEVAENLFNDFEKVNYCEDKKRALMENGALGASLSGSGPSVFGIFESLKAAEACKAALADKYEYVKVCQTI